MEKIEKNLELYLESKRKDFPRFYFISNDELLQILASAQEIDKVEKHLNKCFDNICALDYTIDAGSTEVLGMISSEKEKVIFNKPVKIRPGTNVEAWLKDVQEAMSDTLKKLMKTGYNDYYDASRERKDWVLRHPGQVIATIG
jgi:dynein heavy chain